MIDQIRGIIIPDQFTKLCKSLLCAEYKDFETIDDSGGDGGNDGYSAENKILFQMHCPKKPEKENDKLHTDKVDKDLKKAKALIDSGKYEIEEWIYVTPRELREPVHAYVREKALAIGLRGIVWSSTKLAEIMGRHQHLRSQYSDLIIPDIEKQIEGVEGNIIGHLDSISDVKKTYHTKIEKRYQKQIDHAKEKLDRGHIQSAKGEYETILSELSSEETPIDSHLLFRIYNNLGLCHYSLGDFQSSAIFYEKGYQEEPDNPSAIVNYAHSKIINKLPLEALSIMDTFLEKYPSDKRGTSIKFNALYELGQFEELEEFLKVNKEIVFLHFFNGSRKMATKDFEGASEEFEKMLSLDPDNIQYNFHLSQCLILGTQEAMETNQYPPDQIPDEIKAHLDRATWCLEKIVDTLKDTEQKIELEMAYTNLSQCYGVTGQFEKSIAAANLSIQANPESEAAYELRGVAEVKRGLYKEALASFQECKSRSVDTSEIDGHIAYCSLQCGDLEIAEKNIPQLLEDENGLNINIVDLAVQLYSRNLDFEKVNHLIKRLEEEFPNDARALQIRAAYLRNHGLKGSDILLEKALKSASNEMEKMHISLESADVKFDSKDYVNAGKIYKEYSSISIASPATIRYIECLYMSGQYGKLIECIDTLSPTTKDNPIITEFFAHTNLLLGNLEIAADIFRKLYRLHPKNIQHILYYSICKFRLGKENEAKLAFDTVKNDITDTDDLIALSGGYAFIEEWNVAVELAFKALDDDPNNPKAHMAYVSTVMKQGQASEVPLSKKYIAAFQKSIQEFNDRFPEEKDLESVDVKDGNFDELLKRVTITSEVADSAVELYKESNAPLAFIPEITGKKPFDIWTAFTQIRDVGIKMSFGLQGEVNSEIDLLESFQGKSVIVDIYPLFLLGQLDELSLLTDIFEEVYVHQSVMDEITETLEDKKLSVTKGSKVLSVVNEQHQIMEISPEQVQGVVDLLHKIRAFISNDEKVKIRGLSQERKNDIKVNDLVHKSTSDSALLAHEIGEPFYCDDRAFRAHLREDTDITPFTSQSLVGFAQKCDIIELDEKYDILKKMLDLNYEYISIDANFIYSQLKKYNYSIESIDTIITNIAKSETTIDSLSSVLLSLGALLFRDDQIKQSAKIEVFKKIIDRIKINHDIQVLREAVLANLQSLSSDQPNQIKALMGLIFSEEV